MSTQEADAILDSVLIQSQAPPPQAGGVKDGGALMPPTITEQKPAAEPKKLSPSQRKIATAQEQVLGREQAEALRQEQEEQERRDKTLLGIGEKLVNSSKAHAQDAGRKIANIPTPGSLMFPLMLLVLFGFILLQFGGKTRLQWIWLVLTGNASVSGSPQSQQSSSTPATQESNGVTPPDVTTAATLPAFQPISFSLNGLYGGNPYS